MLKPGFFKNEELAALPATARLLYEGLWCLADREGRLGDRPARIKAEVLPYDRVDVNRLLSQLHEAGFICRYEAGGRAFIHVINFARHQKPHHKEPPSLLQPCPKHEASMAQAPPIDPALAESESLPESLPESESVKAPTARDRFIHVFKREPKALEETLSQIDGGHPPQCVKWVFGLLEGLDAPNWRYAEKVFMACAEEGHGPRERRQYAKAGAVPGRAYGEHQWGG